MCGLWGVLGARLDEADICRMGATLHHRGPDDAGVWLDADAGITLGHRRLAILDLSPAGHQPMLSACGRYVVAFNGEIYNHLDLRVELAAAGAAPVWRGHSDTETLLAAIAHFGLTAALTRMTGMFAFALWDRQQRTLHLIRDRLGEKPLYYGWLGRSFVFASELKALRAHPRWQGEVDRAALTLLLRHGYVPAPGSIYRGIHKLLPGSVLTLAADGSSTTAAYWSARHVAEQGQAQRFAGSEAEALQELERLLMRAVGRQMLADVPLGAFLSGGVDSSTIVALMQAQSARPVQTFTIGFHEAGYNEAEHALAVARHLGTEHTELYVTAQQALDVIPRLPLLYDEPFADSSQIPTLLVAQLARRHVAVSLSGDGGDELFGGYNRYFLGRSLWRQVGWLPRPLRAGLAAGLLGLAPATWNRTLAPLTGLLPGQWRHANLGDKLHKLAGVLAVSGPDALYRGLVSLWPDAAAAVVRGEGDEIAPWHALNPLDDPAAQASLHDFTERMMFLDLVSYLPDDILVKVDRAAMGVSLETRVPLLDHALVEFAWQLPLAMKIRAGQGKWLLRQLLDKHVPSALIERPKMGFGVPLDVWLRGPLRDWAEALLAEERLQREGHFHAAVIRQKWQEHLSGRRNWQYALWNVLMFQSWWEAQHG